MPPALLAALGLALITPAALAQAAGGIVSPAAADGPLPSSPATVRQAPADLDVGALLGLDPAVGGQLTLNLFPDATFVCDLHTFERHANGADTWVGRIQGDEHGWLVVGLAGGQTVINLWTGDGRAFEVRPLSEDGPHLVRQVNAGRLPACGGAVIPGHEHAHAPEPLAADPDAPEGGQRGGGRACSDTGDTIDVLIVYTPAALISAGGPSGITAMAATCVASSNVVYANSGVAMTLRLAGSQQTVYIEDADMGADLGRLRSSGDGFMDEIHAARESLRADMVALLALSPDTGACGIGYLMGTLSTDFGAYAFTVSDVDCAVNNLTFPHELGHNMGCAHDADNADYGLFDYSFGWRFHGLDGNQYRTVMAYAPGSRIPHFSNPAVLYQFIPTGAPLANNARSINEARATVANFRSSGDVLITDHPDALTRDPLQNAVFQVAASGAPTLTYRWQRNNANLNDGGRFSGVHTDRLTITGLTLADAGSYRCVVSNSCDSTTSAPAVLTVRCRADFDGNGSLTLNDFVTFRNAYVAGSMNADFDASGALTLNDFVQFRNAYTAGCP